MALKLLGENAKAVIYVLTLLGEHILCTQFKAQKDEWLMTSKKTAKWLKKFRGEFGDDQFLDGLA